MQRLQLAFASMEEDTGRILFMPDASYYEVRAGAPLATIASETGFSSDDYTVKLAEAEAFYFSAGLVDPIFGYPLSSQRTMIQYHDQPSTDRRAHERRIKYVVSEGELESEHTVAYLVRYRSESYAAGSGPPIEKWFTVTFTAPEGANPGAAANVSISGLPMDAAACGITTSGNALHLNPLPIINGKNELHLLPVEIDQQGYTPAEGVKFCRWLDAFPGGSFDNKFADKDRDRFRIRIAGNIPSITKATIRTTDLYGAVIDGQFVNKATDGDYEIEMKVEGDSMVSTPILLVSDGDDDKKYNGHSSGGESSSDDEPNDQTLLADFNSKIVITFPELNNAQVEFRAQKAVG
jgi:hypothetical protein